MVRGPGVSAEATRWLFDQGVRVMGIDAWGWDAPLHLQAERAKAAGKSGIFWEAHQANLSYPQIERLVNLGPCRRRASTSPAFRSAWWAEAGRPPGSSRSSPERGAPRNRPDLRLSGSADTS